MRKLSKMMALCADANDAFPSATSMLQTHIAERVAAAIGKGDRILIDKILTMQAPALVKDPAASAGKKRNKSIQFLLLKTQSRLRDKLQ